MNGHLDGWIDAYLDGEMTTLQKRQVEAHLASCPACAAMLEQRRALSVLLKEAPAASDLKPEKQFAAEVGVQLSRRQPASALARLSPSLVWQLIPVGLLLALIFVQTALTLSGILSFIPAADKTLISQAPSLAALQITPGVVNSLLGWLGVFGFIDWNWLTGMVFLAAISLAYLAWLASWWAHNQQTAAQLK
jgi:anti-sigma factor RsiW